MAGIYFILPKTGRRGYIGLDKNMTTTFFPRLYDHVYGAYRIARSYRGSTEGAINSAVQSCEKIMAEQMCCSFDYKVLLKEDNCFGLGDNNYQLFCKTWRSTYAEPEMSWAEVCYIYKYFNTFAALNEAWGGAGRFEFNEQSMVNVSVGNKTLQQIVKDANISWYPKREGREFALMNDLFFPYALVFNKTLTYYVNNIIASDVTEDLKKQLASPQLWQNALNGSNTVSLSNEETIGNNIETLCQAIIDSVPAECKQDYVFPNVGIIKTDIIKVFKNAIQQIVDSITAEIYTQSGKINKRKEGAFKITIPLQKWCQQKKEKKTLPGWYPKTTEINLASDVTSIIKKIVPKEIFPYVAQHAQGDAASISMVNIQSYLSSIKNGVAASDQFREGFYYPCRRQWLDEKDGPVQIISETEDMIVFNRPAWGPETKKKISRYRFQNDYNIDQLTIW